MGEGPGPSQQLSPAHLPPPPPRAAASLPSPPRQGATPPHPREYKCTRETVQQESTPSPGPRNQQVASGTPSTSRGGPRAPGAGTDRREAGASHAGNTLLRRRPGQKRTEDSRKGRGEWTPGKVQRRPRDTQGSGRRPGPDHRGRAGTQRGASVGGQTRRSPRSTRLGLEG